MDLTEIKKILESIVGHRQVDGKSLESIRKNREIIDYLNEDPERWQELRFRCETSIANDFIILVADKSTSFDACIDCADIRLKNLLYVLSRAEKLASKSSHYLYIATMHPDKKKAGALTKKALALGQYSQEYLKILAFVKDSLFEKRKKLRFMKESIESGIPLAANAKDIVEFYNEIVDWYILPGDYETKIRFQELVIRQAVKTTIPFFYKKVLEELIETDDRRNAIKLMSCIITIESSESLKNSVQQMSGQAAA